MTVPISDYSSVGVGIVGLSASGGWAAGAHVPALARLAGFELRGLVASSRATAKAAGDKFDVDLAYDNVRELAGRDEIDLIVITVKVPEHRELVMTALDCGKAVLCEWPLGNGLEETEQLAAAAQTRGLPGFVGLQARSAPTIRYMRDLIADGFIGDVLSTSLIGSGGTWGATVDARNAYTLDRANGATMLTIPFGHTIDALTMVLGEFDDIAATTATRRRQVFDGESNREIPMTAEDQIAVSGVLAGGAIASVHFRGGMSAGTNLLWEINGTAGDLVLTGNFGHLQLANIELRGSRAGSDMAVMSPPRRYELAPRDAFAEVPRAYNVANAYAQIRDDLASGTTFAPTFAHAVHRHRLLERIGASASRRCGSR
ncbi:MULTISPECIES: Gfo/Idh/MocA family protein [unclassified Rhodococcus (in: high G+C Gram-positive bacteria)]|uniref:Gfo/Idh/MocA family protein n=1 Tax=unclassified Rhodococcus (in: high G+C Gram-positive bacteria) TaxID=192944 RepID=UPI00163B1F5E|nr:MULTISPECIES: Gfo/Idh/MocA family oxidoreductase [unclassified Rhodococcus (in: high G+C Gram-positive bacteria)]MBC2640243.1 Gfo/Idh/MocA family oxidoreductase [Rhodococcus sp. 3A]MBC2895011.1 Gfo/Idh/MocA family oxidoreductase [Rhodococcus sp. 4CII]